MRREGKGLRWEYVFWKERIREATSSGIGGERELRAGGRRGGS